VHVGPQLIPVGLLVITPPPVPAGETVRGYAPAIPPNVAVTDALPVKVTTHVDVPLQAPDHPVNVEPDEGAAVSVITVPLLNAALQVVPQLIPVGLLVTDPVPVPARVTVSMGCWTTIAENWAITEVWEVSVTTHEFIPEHPPDQPVKIDPDAGVAVRLTFVPEVKFAVQVDPQLIPEGLLLIIPVPVPLDVTLNWTDPGGVVEVPMLPPPQPVARQRAAKLLAITKNFRCDIIFN
jgi:hypothetical protein